MRLAPSSMSAPWASKKRISTVAWSSGLRRTVTPPWARSERTWNRVSGTGASSRSSTWTPDRLRPHITARLSVRATREVSRLQHTTDPFLRLVP